MGWCSRAVPVFVALLVGCGGTVERRGSASGGPSSGDAGAGGEAWALPDGGSAPGSGGAAGGGGRNDPAFEDPGCPDVPPPPAVSECDPFASFNECGFGQRCAPFVQYPADDCGSEVFGTICTDEGPGRQGDDCTEQGCAAQHVCVTTGQGNQCVRICRLEAPTDCAPGLLCQPLDVDGFYICF